MVSSDYFIGKYIKTNLTIPTTKEVFLRSGAAIQQEDLDKILELDIDTLTIADVDPINKGSYLIDTLNIDKNNSKTDAINDIYKVLRPGEPHLLKLLTEFLTIYFLHQKDMIFPMLAE